MDFHPSFNYVAQIKRCTPSLLILRFVLFSYFYVVASWRLTPQITFGKCIEMIRKHYKEVLCMIQRRPWDPYDFTDLKRLFTELHLFKYDRSSGEILRVPFNGDVRDIFTVKVDGESPKRIILTGPGGYGKTCAVLKMAYDWAYEVDDSPMKNIPALFVLRLREVDKDMELGEAIISQLLGLIPGVTPKMIEDGINHHQDECALVCDGYDEYAQRIKGPKSDNSLVQTLQNKKLRKLPVLVTTRPFLQDDFMDGDLARIYFKFDISGFSVLCAQKYISRYFDARSSPEVGRELLEYLEGNLFLTDFFRVPLFCTMICHLFEVRALSTTHSLRSLLHDINQFLFQHVKSKRELDYPPLPKVLEQLGKVALDGLLHDSRKLVFKKEDFKDIVNVYQISLKLGILSSTTIPLKHIRGQEIKNTTVEFFHKWEQEYCASLYLTSQDAGTTAEKSQAMSES